MELLRSMIKTKSCSDKFYVLILLTSFLFCCNFGCMNPYKCRIKADKRALEIIKEKQKEVLGNVQEFSIERSSEISRSRLLINQKLPYSCGASLGSDKLGAIKDWPEEYNNIGNSISDSFLALDANRPLKLTLTQALQLVARNSFEYQNNKEKIFEAALNLDLEKNEFRSSFIGQVEYLLGAEVKDGSDIQGNEQSGSLNLGKKLKSGVSLTTSLAVDLANLLTLGGASSLGIMADATISIPLLRGSGKHIVMESLNQAERDVIYSIYEFERFKGIFAVKITSEYLSVLKQNQEVLNAKKHYQSLIESAKRARSLADGGRATEIEVDQAVQNGLRARQRWITAISSYNDQMDSFKTLLGLPPDAQMVLEDSEFNTLISSTIENNLEKIIIGEDSSPNEQIQTKNTHSDFWSLASGNPGPLEIDESSAIKFALDNRLDLKIAQGKVYDAQRAVIIKADALGAELTLFGTTQLGERRSIETAKSRNASLSLNKGLYRMLLSLDLPFDRELERNEYRLSFIKLEKVIREIQILEDQIKLSVRKRLRDLFRLRETVQIQKEAVIVAEKRVKSTAMFIEAGRAEMRDLLDAQDALLSAQNDLTSAIVNYRIVELELQSDLGALKVDQQGLYHEFKKQEMENAK